MNIFKLGLFILGICAILASGAQAEIPAKSLPAAAQDMEPMPVVELRALDKVTARTVTFQVDVNSTIKFGGIYIKPQACRKAPPIEQPESAAFLQIWETPHNEKPRWIFSGWMFASSPGLSSMDHPIYDVWVLDCLPDKEGTQQSPGIEKDKIEGEGEVSASETPARPDL